MLEEAVLEIVVRPAVGGPDVAGHREHDLPRRLPQLRRLPERRPRQERRRQQPSNASHPPSSLKLRRERRT
jgi:hypothetical protein